MKRLVFPAILWLLCLLIHLPGISDLLQVLALLLSLSYAALVLYVGPSRIWPVCIAAQILCVLFPPLQPYLPLSAYLLTSFVLQERRLKPLAFTWILPLLAVLPNFYQTFSLLCLCLLGMLLAYCSFALEAQYRRFYALQDNTRKEARALEQKNRLLLEKQDYQVQLATLTERNRIAREIHDNVGHLLTRALFQISALQVIQTDNQEPLALIKTTLEDAMTNIRASVHDLHDDALDLQLELQKIIEAFPACLVTLRYECSPVPPAIHYCFIAVAKEALSNIARHSNATQAQISVLEHPALYQMVIQDNGAAGAKSSQPGIGLQSIEERVTALQGVFRIQQDHGYRLFISIPKKEEANH